MGPTRKLKRMRKAADRSRNALPGGPSFFPFRERCESFLNQERQERLQDTLRRGGLPMPLDVGTPDVETAP